MIFDMRNSKELLEEFRANQDQVMHRYGLSSNQMELLKRGDPIEMYNSGIYPYLLHYYWITIMNAKKHGVAGLQLFKRTGGSE